MTKVTIQDVADYARVSRSTVSRVLNHNLAVDVELAARVNEAVRVLGYHPNRSARRLRKQTEDVLGVLISDIRNPFFGLVIRGIEDAAYQHNMNLVLCNTDEDITKLETYLRVMEAERVAGLIVVPTSDDDVDLLREVQLGGIPIVLLDRFFTDADFDSVTVKNVEGAYHAVLHLIEHGYRRIGILYADIQTGHERYQGYVRALQESGLPFDDTLVKVGDYTMDTAYHLAKDYATMPQPPDALFTASNFITLGVMRVLRESRRRIPQDIALVGFDDTPWAAELYAPLTAVSQPTYKLGQQAVLTLRQRLQQPDAPYQHIALPTTLIIRESCGCSGEEHGS